MGAAFADNVWGEQSLDCSDCGDCGLKGRQMLGEVGLRSQEYVLFSSGSEAEEDKHVVGVRSWCGTEALTRVGGKSAEHAEIAVMCCQLGGTWRISCP